MQWRRKTNQDFAKELYERHADMCKVFSNAIRLRVLSVIGKREMPVAGIAEKLGVPLGTVSPHLLMMKQRRVLVSRKKGNQVFYRLANPKILKAFDLIREILSEQIRLEGLLGKQLQQVISGAPGNRNEYKRLA